MPTRPATFTAPEVAGATPLAFRLTVEDPHGGQATDDVVVIVLEVIVPETAGADGSIGDNKVAGALAVGVLALFGIAGIARRRRR